MTKRERSDDAEPEAKREKSHHDSSEAHTGPALVGDCEGEAAPLGEVKVECEQVAEQAYATEEKDDGDGREALVPKAEFVQVVEAQGAEDDGGDDDDDEGEEDDVGEEDDGCEDFFSESDIDEDDNFEDFSYGDDESYEFGPYSTCFQTLSYFFNRDSHRASTSSLEVVPIAALHEARKYLPRQLGSFGDWAVRSEVYEKLEHKLAFTSGKGFLFWFRMKNDAGDRIRVVCFNDVIDRFIDKVEQGKDYVLGNVRLKEAYGEKAGGEVHLRYDSSVEEVISGEGERKPEGAESKPNGAETLTAGEAEKRYLAKKVATLQKHMEETSSQAQDYKSQVAEVERCLELARSEAQGYKSELEQLKAEIKAEKAATQEIP